MAGRDEAEDAVVTDHIHRVASATLPRLIPGFLCLVLAFGVWAGEEIERLANALAREVAEVEPIAVDLGGHQVPVELSDGSTVWLDPVEAS
jgi:hypothetical protein